MIALDKRTHFLACYSVTLTTGICSTPEEGAAAGLIAGYMVLNGMRWLKIV